MDGKQAAIVVREYFEGISGICPVVFQTHSITRVDDGYEVMCGVCSAMVHGAKYRGLVGVDGKLAKIERVDLHPGSTDGDVVPDSIIIGNLRRINTRQHKQIYDQYDTIGGLRATISGLEERDARKTTAIDELQKTIANRERLIDKMEGWKRDLEAELSARKDDSRVLMQVAGWVKQWDTTPPAYRSSHLDMRQIAIIVEDYLDAPEPPVVALKPPIVGTRVVSKNEETQIIDEDVMEAVWPACQSQEDAVEVMAQKETIEEMKSKRKEDSNVLMQVVEALREWQGDPFNPRHIVEDYLDVTEIPDRKETGAITDQVIDEALDTIVSNMFNETAGAMQTAIAHQDRRIKYLDAQNDKKSAFISSLLRNDKRFHRLLDERRADVRDRDKIIESLRVDVADRDRHIEALESAVDFGQSRIDLLVEKKSNCIDELMRDLDARNQVIKGRRQDNARLTGKLERIEKVTKDAIAYVHIDEITKIIQEDKP